MEKTDKSAEDILCKYETYVKYSDVPIFLEENVLKAMHEYTAQQLSEYKEVIKELLPIAERMQSHCESGESFSYENEYDFNDSKEYQKAIDRAKALLQGSNQGQPPQAGEQI